MNGVGVALIVPLEFTTMASMLPSESASPTARIAAQFGGIPELGSAGSKSMVELYPQIARSQTVLDWAVPPVKKSEPKRSMYVLGIIFVGVVGPAEWMKKRGRNRDHKS